MGCLLFTFFVVPLCVIVRDLKWIETKASFFIGAPGAIPGAIPAFYFSAHPLSFSLSLEAAKAKIPITLTFPFGYFCCVLFTSPLCDVTPVVCQTEGRRCGLSFFFQTLLH